MTGRDRITRIIERLPTDRPAWTTLVDDVTRSAMFEEHRRMPLLDFYRAIGCDLLQFGNYGMGESEQVPLPCRLVRPDLTTEWRHEPDGVAVRTETTPWGTLTAIWKNWRLVKYPVETIEEVRILRRMWDGSHYEETPGMEESFRRMEERIGDIGLFIPTLHPSPVQTLLEFEMGVASFYYLLQDHPQEVEGLLEAMHRCRMQEYEIVARRTLAPAVMPVENTSSTLIGPAMYERLSLPQISDFIAVMHRHGKKAVLHMCGHLKALLPAIKKTELDGINGLTPPPVGSATYEEALDALGDDVILLGSIMDPTVFQAPTFSKERLWRELDRVYTPRVRRAHFLLWVAADGLPTPLERFLAIGEWFEKQ